MGIGFVSFYDFSFGFWNFSTRGVFIVFFLLYIEKG
jgi:hypothetical protein